MNNNEKNIVLFFVLVFAWLMLVPYLMRLTGLEPPPRKKLPPPGAAVEKERKEKAGLVKAEAPAPAGPEAQQRREKGAEKLGGKSEQGALAVAAKPAVEFFNESDLVLGSVFDKSPTGYRLLVQLTQRGAGVESVASSRFDAELEDRQQRKASLQFIKRDNAWPCSLTLTLGQGEAAPKAEDSVPEASDGEDMIRRQSLAGAEDPLVRILWEVVRDEQGRIVRPIASDHDASGASRAGQAVVFRTTAESGVVVTKTFRLWQNTDGFECEIAFESPKKELSVVYNLLGPHGIPIEGEWYTTTYRDMFFGQVSGGSTKIDAHSAYDIASTRKTFDNTKLPLRFAGVENQYFATLIEPFPAPTGQQDRWDERTTALVLERLKNDPQKADVGVRITSLPLNLRPGERVAHTYRVFAGPKTDEALKPYGADELATFHKSQWIRIPFAQEVARFIITPVLDFTYKVTERVARLWGGKQGNYGIAIILLTVLVRALMFPLGRKQARYAQKLQELQPQLKELQEKYKDDKLKQSQETSALMKKHGVSHVAGCLPALVQLPIFVGLWQALNSSVSLRQAPFLWIRDLAAPDMLYRFPFDITLPLLGKVPWFNLLPFAVVGLMLFQNKLFSPPATTPEAEMQQKTMKFMMVFMGFMFYKVPSGLGIYFITSSAWAIGERLLLPKVTHAHISGGPATAEAAARDEKSAGARPLRAGPNGEAAAPRGGKGPAEAEASKAKPPSKLSQFWEHLLEEASKDSTYRKMIEDRQDKGRDKGKPRTKPRKR